MGLRGPLPKISTTPAQPLYDLDPPDWLNAGAAVYWRTHAKQCADNRLLTKQTADSFALLSDLRSRLENLRGKEYLDTLKAWTSLAKLFRLLPTDKPGAPTEQRHNLPEFDS